MQTLNLELGVKSYPIYIGPGLLGKTELLKPKLGPSNVIVTDSRVGPLYLDALKSSLGECLTGVVVLPEGEPYKSIGSVMSIVDTLTAHACGRDTTIIALGGGVVGDMAGFAASIYLRGVRFVQIPTTLLAQVDSAVGGKTGVNHERGKNLIGAFHQPACVISDTETLRTLDQRQYRSGLGEVIKHAMIADADFFDWLEANMNGLLKQEPSALSHAIARCCKIKADIVARDEREAGPRVLLNFGHTFAHAIESDTAYNWLHGEAVAAGLVLASRLSRRLKLIDKKTVARVEKLVDAAGLPVKAPEIPAKRWSSWMRVDKKSAAGKLRFVVLDKIGGARLVSDVPDSVLEKVLRDAHL